MCFEYLYLKFPFLILNTCLYCNVISFRATQDSIIRLTNIFLCLQFGVNNSNNIDNYKSNISDKIHISYKEVLCWVLTQWIDTGDYFISFKYYSRNQCGLIQKRGIQYLTIVIDSLLSMARKKPNGQDEKNLLTKKLGIRYILYITFRECINLFID